MGGGAYLLASTALCTDPRASDRRGRPWATAGVVVSRQWLVEAFAGAVKTKVSLDTKGTENEHLR